MAASVFGSSASSIPGLSRLYSGTSISGSSDADSVLMDPPFMHSFTSGDFSLPLSSPTDDVAMAASTSSSTTASAHHPHGLAGLSVSRSLSSSSVSSSLSRPSSRPRSSKLSGGGGDTEREDGGLSAVNSDSSGSNGSLWHCSYLGCNKVYRKSSGRSIRRHVVSCFKVHWPGGAELSDSELSSLIATQQDRGLLVTGLRRWKMRQSRRPANELTESEKWRCPWNCGKFYRSTSSRSIQRHATTCPNRAGNRSAEQGTPTSADSKRIKRQRDEEGGDEDGVRGSEDDRSSDSSDDDNDEAEETTDSSSSARSANARMRSAAARSSHSKSSTTGSSSNKPALRLHHAQNDFSSSHTSASTSASQLHQSGQFGGSRVDGAQDDVDFLYPDSSTGSSTPSSVCAAGASTPSPSYTVLSSQKREVALQLQHLLRDIHRRHGTDHPVFQSPMMTPHFLDGLLNKNVDDAVDDMETEQQRTAPQRAVSLSVDVADNSAATAGSSSNNMMSTSSTRHGSSRRGSWALGSDSASLMSPSSASLSSGPPTPHAQSLSSSPLHFHWTCACGSSFKITSSKSIQKHRANCDAHTQHQMLEQQQQQQQAAHNNHHHEQQTAHKQAAAHEPRVKREKY